MIIIRGGGCSIIYSCGSGTDECSMESGHGDCLTHFTHQTVWYRIWSRMVSVCVCVCVCDYIDDISGCQVTSLEE